VVRGGADVPRRNIASAKKSAQDESPAQRAAYLNHREEA
jgi:hypothetical protein